MALNVEIAELCFSFGPGSHRLRDVSLGVPEAELCCLLGPNGAGKTTLIRCLLGFLRPESGSLRVAGRAVAELSPRALAQLVAYVPQSTVMMFPFTALDIAVMGRTPHMRITDTPSSADRRAALATLDRFGIGHLAQRPFAQLSGGERQLTMLARALVQEAVVLVLDEPTSSLDYGNEVAILQVISDLVVGGPSVLMSTHQPNHALTWADRAVLMRDGAILASGRPEEVITAEGLSSLYGVPIHIARVPSPTSGGGPQLVCLPDVRSSKRGRLDEAEAEAITSIPDQRRPDGVTT